jgi:hypothetical protein
MSPSRRTKGDGALFQRKDGMWIGRVELPAVDGRRRRRTVSSKDQSVARARLRALQREVDGHQTAECKWCPFKAAGW